MNESDDIKALIPIICPHCEKALVVEFLTTANLLNIEETKKILESVETINENLEVNVTKEEEEEGEQEEG